MADIKIIRGKGIEVYLDGHKPSKVISIDTNLADMGEPATVTIVVEVDSLEYVDQKNG